MAVAESAATITRSTEVEGIDGPGRVEARDAREVEAGKYRGTRVTPHATRLDKVIEAHDFPEVEPPVPVGVEQGEHAGPAGPRVAVSLKEGRELGRAHDSVPVGVHGAEEVPSAVLELTCAVVVVRPRRRSELIHVHH